MQLIDTDTAMEELRITDSAREDEVEDKAIQASGIVADYLKADLSAYAIDGSSKDELPAPIKAATLLVLRALYDGGDPLNSTVLALLHRQRDPAMA